MFSQPEREQHLYSKLNLMATGENSTWISGRTFRSSFNCDCAEKLKAMASYRGSGASDHGFSSFGAVNLNTWLMKEGFLVLDDPRNVSDEEMFPHVDWSKTQAYSIGLNGIYLNLRGREREGIVEPGNEADAIVKKIVEKLQDAHDPANGKPMVGGLTPPHREFHGEMLSAAPEILVGYMPGYRSSWQTVLGAVPAALVEDKKGEWRADHCIDKLPISGFTFSAVPVKVKGMGTFPVRAFAKLRAA